MKETIFNTDECQVLLDLIDRAIDISSIAPINIQKIWVFFTDEEKTVYKKLKEAGKFYNPKKG